MKKLKLIFIDSRATIIGMVTIIGIYGANYTI